MPSYLERMVGALQTHGASLVTLGSWLEFHAIPGRCRRYGTSPADLPSLVPLPPDQYHSRPPPAHSYLWGFGFSYVHTSKLAQCCPYPPSNMGEDYDKVMQAARRSLEHELEPCLAFADTLGSAVVCHINHSANTSATMQTHAVLSGSALGDSERGAAAAEAFFESFDRLFDSPCHHLLEPTMRYLVESGARERCRPKFTTTSWASRSDAAAVSLS